jgi:predicted acyltransferase (DUF342 family)
MKKSFISKGIILIKNPIAIVVWYFWHKDCHFYSLGKFNALYINFFLLVL